MARNIKHAATEQLAEKMLNRNGPLPPQEAIPDKATETPSKRLARLRACNRKLFALPDQPVDLKQFMDDGWQ